ncbi:MAG: Fe-S cluster assembly protein SufD [Bdellovibrionales bacterium]|nr:Fe-S cluster assembly protein SufD [Bdellovibrionales bacterium]
MSSESNEPKWFQQNFHSLEHSLNGLRESSFHQKRQSAYDRFSQLGFPTPKNEDWKYTNLRPVVAQVLERATAESVKSVDASLVENHAVPGLEAPRLCFVNGFFSKELSVTELPKGCTFISLSELLHDDTHPLRDQFEERFCSLSQGSDDAISLFHNAFVEDGLILHIAKDASLDKPIEALFFGTSGPQGVVRYPRLFVIAEQGSKATLIERYVSSGDSPSLTASYGEIFVEANASFTHYRFVMEQDRDSQIARTAVHQERDSRFATTCFSFGGSMVRNEVTPVLDGPGCETVLNGLSVLSGSQHVDNHTIIDHAHPNCESHELYKGIYAERSEGVFCGTIIVRPDAQKTNAIQSNQGLLLDDTASLNSKPQLKIWADDVKCTHGATVGQLDQDALFYLRSRGISKNDAQKLLIQAFAGDVTKEVSIEALRDYAEAEVIARLPQ